MPCEVMRRRWPAGGLAVLLLVAGGWIGRPIAATGDTASVTPASHDQAVAPVAWLSTGDSYSSGEGLAGSGIGSSTSDHCAQSPNAYGPLAADLLRTAGWRIGPQVFSACTGALTSQFYTTDPTVGASLWDWSVLQGAPATGRFDVISMSLGGNDIGFSHVVQSCLGIPQSWTDLAPTCESETALKHTVDNYMNARIPLNSTGTRYANGVAAFYKEIAKDHLTSRGVLVIAGYPRLFAPADQWPLWTWPSCNGMGRSAADALGRVAEYLDAQLSSAVHKADPSGRHIRYLSRLQLFNSGGGHALCNSQEWLNGIPLGIGDASLRLQHSFHPNEAGHAATAAALARLLKEQFGTNAPTTTTTTTTAPPAPSSPSVATAPPQTVPPSNFTVGSRFSAWCVVAWPTAPQRSDSDIEMRMTCQGVPEDQYLFTDVAYPDPNLDVTPSTGQMFVKGKVIGTTRSDFGFTTLDVLASTIQFQSSG